MDIKLTIRIPKGKAETYNKKYSKIILGAIKKDSEELTNKHIIWVIKNLKDHGIDLITKKCGYLEYAIKTHMGKPVEMTATYNRYVTALKRKMHGFAKALLKREQARAEEIKEELEKGIVPPVDDPEEYKALLTEQLFTIEVLP